jgi:hypothetical protein
MSLDPITQKAIQAQVVSDYLKGQKIDAFLASEAESFKAGEFRQNQILNRGPRDRDLVDELFAELRPEQWSLVELKKRGVEAFHTTRAIGINGHSYAAGDVILLWPTSPVSGFATREQLQGLQGTEIQSLSDGSLRVVEPFYLAGHNYREGDTLGLWPETPTHGFIRAQEALELFRASDIEPAQLTPAA